MAHGTESLERVIDKADHTGILNLSGRNLRQFPMSAQDLSDLQDTLEADISRNRFDKVPREICMFSGLAALNCHHNSIRSVPDYMTYMGNLKILDLSRNYITNLPHEICRLKLVSLNLSHNRLVCIPPAIGNMSSLKSLDLSCNLLPDLPEGICNLHSLKHLNLHNNELKELPQSIDQLPLRFLDVSTNLIKAVPTSLRHIKSLVTLDVSDNPLESPPVHVCVRGRIHIFKYLQAMDERGPDPVVYHPTPSDIKKRGRGHRKSRPVSGVSQVSIESSTSSFADEMHRFVDSAFGNLTSRKDMHKSDTDISSKGSALREDGGCQLHAAGVGGISPGRRRVQGSGPGYGTLPRSGSGDTSRTIHEEPPPLDGPVVAKQNSLPADDNHRTTVVAGSNNNSVYGGRSLPGENKPRSGSWNSRQRPHRDEALAVNSERDRKAYTPVMSSKTPDLERRSGGSSSHYAMRSAKSSSDIADSAPLNSATEVSQETTTIKAPVLIKVDDSGPDTPIVTRRSPTPSDSKSPRATKKSRSPEPTKLVINSSPEATIPLLTDIVDLDKSPDHTRRVFQNTGALTTDGSCKSPEASVAKSDDSSVTEKSSEVSKEQVKSSPTNKSLASDKGPPTAKKPPKSPAQNSPVAVKKPAPQSTAEPAKKPVAHKSPEMTTKTAVNKSPEATRAAGKPSAVSTQRRASDVRNSPSPARKAVNSSTGAAKKPAETNKTPVKSAATKGPELKKTDSPRKSSDKSPEAIAKKHSSPARDNSLSPKGSPTATKKHIRATSKSPVATKRNVVTPNKSPVATRKATASPAKTSAKPKTVQPRPSSGKTTPQRSISPVAPISPNEKKAKRKSIQDLQLVFKELGGSEGGSGEPEEQTTPTATDQPMVLGGGGGPSEEGGRRENGGEVPPQEQLKEPLEVDQISINVTGGQEKGGAVSPGPAPSQQGEKEGDDSTLTRPKAVKPKKKRTPSTSSTGSTRSRTSSTEEVDELKELMRKRSLPRKPVNFTVRRQEMNMMHGYKKMAAVQKKMEDVLGVVVNQDFLESLEDGANLCLMVNKLHPGTIAHVSTCTDGQPLSVPRKAKNVDGFVKACRKIGIETHVTTGDILSIKDPMKVIKCIEELLESV